MILLFFYFYPYIAANSQSFNSIPVDTTYPYQIIAVRPTLAKNRHVAPRRINRDVSGLRGATARYTFGCQCRRGIKIFSVILL